MHWHQRERTSGLKMFAQHWLDIKKRTNHPLVHGSPVCGDEAHEVLGAQVASLHRASLLPVTPVPTAA
jgi:hypothetical protein